MTVALIVIAVVAALAAVTAVAAFGLYRRAQAAARAGTARAEGLAQALADSQASARADDDAEARAGVLAGRLADTEHQLVETQRQLVEAGSRGRAPDPPAGDPDTGDPDTGDPDTSDPDTGDPDTSGPDTSDPVSPASPGRSDAALEALWALARLDQQRTWRLTMGVAAGDSAPYRQLGDMLEAEVDRIREETGTPGQLHATLARQPEPPEAIVALRGIQALLAVLTRHCQAYDLFIDTATATAALVATVVCEGFDGPDSVADEATALLAAVEPAGGRLDVQRDHEGRLRAELIFSPPTEFRPPTSFGPGN